MAQEFSPIEIFKRATASTLRAIAERDDLTVGFGPEPPGLSGSRVKLPNPARDLPPEEAAQLRGAADSLALRLRYHDDGVHAKRVPGSPVARAIFEGVEQARVEALGARRMAGVASNLTAMLDQRYRRQGYDRLTERSDSTLAEAIRLLTREELTGAPPPPAAQRLVDLWRPVLEGKIGRDIRELDKLIEDQDSYGKVARKLIKDLDLDLGDAESSSENEDKEGEGEETGDAESQNESGEGSVAGAQSALESGIPESKQDDSDPAGAEEMSGELTPGAGDEDPGRPGRPGILPRGANAGNDAAAYRAFTMQF